MEKLKVGASVIRDLAECLEAIGHPKRLEIAQYCQQRRRFTEITLNLRLNPASFKFHSKVLMDCHLLEKPERGIYETTKLGRLMLQLVNKADEILHA